MTDRGHRLSLSRQVELPEISRDSLYYAPRPANAAALKLMRRIDELHMEYSFAGSRMVKGLSRQKPNAPLGAERSAEYERCARIVFT